MFNYSQSSVNGSENAELIRKISRSISKNGLKVNVMTFNDFSLPAFKDELIPELESMFSNDLSLLYNSIEEVFGFNNFNNVKLSKVIKSIDSGLVINESFLIFDDVLYVRNPLTEKTENLLNKVKIFDKEDVLFSKVGIISSIQLESINKLCETNKYKNDSYNSVLSLDVKFQRIIDKAILNNVSEVKITLTDSGVYKVDYKKKIGYLNKLREYVGDSGFLYFINNRFEISSNLLSKHKNVNIRVVDEGFDSVKILICKNNDELFGDLISEIVGYEGIEAIDSIKSNNFGLSIISSNDDSSGNLSHQIAGEIRRDKSVDIMIADEYRKHYIKHSLFTSEYDDLKKSTADVIVIKCNDSDDLLKAIECSVSGKMVICHMKSSSMESTLQILSDSYKEIKDLASIQLKSIIHISQIDKVCKNCKSDEQFTSNKKHHYLSKASENFNFLVSKENSKGCDLCVKGYDDKINIFEIIKSSPPLSRFMTGEIKTSDLIIELKGDDWPDIITMAMDYVKSGETTISSVINTVGFPR